MLDSNEWWVNSGTIQYIAKIKKGLVSLKKFKAGEHRVYMGNNTYLDVEGVGTYRLDRGDNIMVLKDIFYAPKI